MVEIFATKTRDEWAALLEGTDACAAAVVGMFDAPSHPHLAARNTFVTHEGYVQPAPAPRFSRTPSAIQGSAAADPIDAAELLRRWSKQPSLKLA
jgi:alpha-methylacyl-CoA racemase